jgi:hypothetical protein
MRRLAASGLVATLGLAAALFGANPARAQATGCEQIQKLLQQRQAIVADINSSQKSKKQMTPQDACNKLGSLVSNGNNALKFATANQDWCQIPPSFIEGMKADNEKAAGIRGKACNAVRQQADMMRKAQQAQRQQSNNPFGGSDSVTGGPMRVPQGAL